jgi:hypothetical protein
MLLLGKIALGCGATAAMAAAWICHEGMIRVDVDEGRAGGSHVHLFVPATAVSVGLRVVPRHYLTHAAQQSRECLPLLREISKELPKYPNAELVDVRSKTEHVRVAVRNGKVYLDVVDGADNIHISFPAETLTDVADRLEDAAPGV